MTDYPFWSNLTCCCIFAIGTAIFAVWVALKATGKRIGALRQFVKDRMRRRWR